MSLAFLAATVWLVPRAPAQAKDVAPQAATKPAAGTPLSKPAASRAAVSASPSAQAPAATAGDKAAPPAGPQAQPQNPHQWRDNRLIDFFCTLGVLLVLYPIARFLLKQWLLRREKLLGALDGDAIVYYYQQFRAGSPVVRQHPPIERKKLVDHRVFPKEVSDAYMESFRKDFSRWYGRKYYIAPVAMLALLSAVSGWWADEILRAWASNGIGPGTSLRALVASGLAGAFVWVISDELDRLRKRDFTTSDVYYYDFRILLAIPFAWALSASSIDGKLLGVPTVIPLAYFLGSFPTKTLFTIARRIGSQQLKLGDDQVNGTLELEKLQSIGKTNAERFNDEGITTITALAYVDPIDLTIRTNFDFSYVVDCVSQALAWIYFGKNEKYDDLLGLSLRGSQEVYSVIQNAGDASNAEKKARAQQTILDAAADLKIPPNAFRSSLDQIAEDPYTKFLVNVWCCLADVGHRPTTKAVSPDTR